MNPIARINIPASIFIGAGAAGKTGYQARLLGLRRALVVCDPHIAASGRAGEIARVLAAEGVETTVYNAVTPDPTDRNVAEGLDMLRREGCDGVVAIGGGSSIDAGKAIAVMAANPGRISDYAGYDQIPHDGLPMIAIPTTAGTGSEMTKVTVITDTERHIKMMLLDPRLLPSAALVDYTLSLSMPKPLTAHVGVDTLTHGIEAYVSCKASAMTDGWALSCIRLTGRHLKTAWTIPDDHTAREGMMLAASQGGMAFANSSVCLVHGMSRPLGAVFHLPHGLSNAVLLPAVTRFSVSGAPDRYAQIARTLGWAAADSVDTDACERLIEGLEALNLSLEIPRLSGCGISMTALETALDKMAANALASGSPQNNPRVPSPEDIKQLYLEAY
ncbi:MAG: iron-containing alcohol dehydrogenase [candidate division Zixibacteria bacterium]|nr:iron-containing alcohol dehydrogenase [candidate division Zixibacteria bacterium]